MKPWRNLGSIPKEDAATIRRTATFDIGNVHEIEKRTNHDVTPFWKTLRREWVQSRAGFIMG